MRYLPIVLLYCTFSPEVIPAQPNISPWLLNCSGLTGYNNQEANVQAVNYDATYLYISSSGIPAYTIGPWPGNPSVAVDQNYVFRIRRNPQPNAGTPVATPLGPIGVLINGVPIFNAKDAMTYQNQNIWHQNARVVEATGMDSCNGHPAPGMGGQIANGRYHHHRDPICLYAPNPAQHGPLVGFAYDGYPVYARYGFANANGSGGVKQILSSYRLRSITQRTSLPDGTILQPNQYGPPVNATYPLGYYIEDFEYVPGLGDLDEHNGRTAVTPEYPGGTYAYFVTRASNGDEAYPYLIGPTYYGQVDAQVSQPGGLDHVTIPGGTQQRSCDEEPVGTVLR